MKIAILTNEYPPNVYGGAGVHVEYLTRELAALDGGRHQVQVLCFGDQHDRTPGLSVTGVAAPRDPAGPGSPSREVLRDPAPGSRHERHARRRRRRALPHLVHRTSPAAWSRCCTACPLVLTTHSLEPHRPWKVEQLGTAYQASTWIERTAYENADGVVAVSAAMRRDVHALYGVSPERIRVIHNGIDLRPVPADPRPRRTCASSESTPSTPFVLFVGRITRQKGIIHLVNAIKYSPARRAGRPLRRRTRHARDRAGDDRRGRTGTRGHDHTRSSGFREMLPKETIIPLYTHAAIFVCPSVYEPFGIINLEAMACETPVVASAVGGIPEVVDHGETGLLVPSETIGSNEVEPRHPEQFARDLAAASNTLLDNPALRATMARKARAAGSRNISAGQASRNRRSSSTSRWSARARLGRTSAIVRTSTEIRSCNRATRAAVFTCHVTCPGIRLAVGTNACTGRFPVGWRLPPDCSHGASPRRSRSAVGDDVPSPDDLDGGLRRADDWHRRQRRIGHAPEPPLASNGGAHGYQRYCRTEKGNGASQPP